VGVNISIKNVPEEKLELLKARAKRNHRSLQGELLALIEAAVESPRQRKAMTLDEVVEQGERLGLKTDSDSVRWIREDRDSR
jgi:plasmid stability protein